MLVAYSAESVALAGVATGAVITVVGGLYVIVLVKALTLGGEQVRKRVPQRPAGSGVDLVLAWIFYPIDVLNEAGGFAVAWLLGAYALAFAVPIAGAALLFAFFVKAFN